MAASKQSFCIYCRPHEINDATFRYVEVIRHALVKAGLHDLGNTDSLKTARQASHVVTISCLAAARIVLGHHGARIIHWFQGIEAVERRYLHGGVKGYLRFLLWSCMERYLLKHAWLKLFVSEEMRDFLGDRSTPSSRSVVMPCYNASIDAPAFVGTDRYGRLDLVYAGSLYPWQCVIDVLQTYKQVLKLRPDARLTLFTREIERAQSLCDDAGLTGVQIMSVSPADLVQELRRFSFGFILRAEMSINRVSTPTKLSTYMAAGVIPVVTTATPALVSMLSNTAYKVVVAGPDAHADIANRICELSASSPNSPAVYRDYLAIFEQFMDDEVNAGRVAQVIGAG